MFIHTDYETPKELNHIRFYFAQIEKYEKALNNEQMGRLFFAIANYAQTNVKQDVDGDILYPYEEAVYKIDKARAAAKGL